jgi:glycosyltransferase involved in cell wall biosynthesis
MPSPLVTIAVPSYNQGQFLQQTLSSIFEQDLPVEVFVMDGGSTDESVEVIRSWEHKLAGWRTRPDEGQAAAINEGIALGTAPHVCWLNSDDFFYPGGLRALLTTMSSARDCHFAYGRCWSVSERGKKLSPYLTRTFSPRVFANFCFIAQPSTLISRSAWEAVDGLNQDMHMAFDYDLWWRLYLRHEKPAYCPAFVSATRMHKQTKTATQVELHYQESMDVVRRHWGSVPLKWHAALPLMKLLRKFSAA